MKTLQIIYVLLFLFKFSYMCINCTFLGIGLTIIHSIQICYWNSQDYSCFVNSDEFSTSKINYTFIWDGKGELKKYGILVLNFSLIFCKVNYVFKVSGNIFRENTFSIFNKSVASLKLKSIKIKLVSVL